MHSEEHAISDGGGVGGRERKRNSTTRSGRKWAEASGSASNNKGRSNKHECVRAVEVAAA